MYASYIISATNPPPVAITLSKKKKLYSADHSHIFVVSKLPVTPFAESADTKVQFL